MTTRTLMRQLTDPTGPAINVVVALVFLLPLLWLVIGIFTPAGELIAPGLRILPSRPTLDNLATIFSGQVDIPQYAMNTAMLCILRAVGTVVSSCLAAYALTKLEWPGRNIVFAITIGLLILPPWTVIVPQYHMFGNLGWLGTFLPLIVPMLTGDPFTVFLLATFMRGMPEEMSEAAQIDGAGHLRTLVQVLVPNMTGALAVAFVLSVIDTYNDFFGQLIYLNDPSQYTLALAAFQFVKVRGAPDIGAIIAFTAIALIPLIIIFALAQRQLRQVNLASGLK
ncbi:MAG: carbohydrate ABC transporter permease [Devosia sp.]